MFFVLKSLKEEELHENVFKSLFISPEKNKVDSRKYQVSAKIKDNDYMPCLIRRKQFMHYLFKTRNNKVKELRAMDFQLWQLAVK